MPTAHRVFETMNSWGAQRKPFLFLLDFEKEQGEIVPLCQIEQTGIRYQINATPPRWEGPIDLTKMPISFAAYKKQFDAAQRAFQQNEASYLNLTTPTPIATNLSLADIYTYTRAKYKLYWAHNFVCFSPEPFVQIKAGKIYSYPMKGTIRASVDHAAQTLLNDPKERAEHRQAIEGVATDLRQVAHQVKVPRFRFIETVQTPPAPLLQASSEVCGQLADGYRGQLGTIFDRLLPAGSICGTPKADSFKLIRDIETYRRQFYTGVFGVFDGNRVDSAVLIRFIEQTEQGLVYKSGGGITAQSNAGEEYNEMIDKVYVPIN